MSATGWPKLRAIVHDRASASSARSSPLPEPTRTRRCTGSLRLRRSTAVTTPETESCGLAPRAPSAGTLARIGRSIASVMSWADSTTGRRRLSTTKMMNGTRPPSSAPKSTANQIGKVEVLCSGLANTSWKIGPWMRCSIGRSVCAVSNTPASAGMTCALDLLRDVLVGVRDDDVHVRRLG